MKKLVSIRKISVLLLVVSGFFFVSCSSVNLEENEDNLFSAPINESQNRQNANGVGSDGIQDSVEISSQNLSPKAISEISLGEYDGFEPSVYFDYDRFDVKPSYVEVIKKIAQIMRENRTSKILLEGHSDERGTREYNVALGHKRAESVAKALEAEGINRQRMDTVSFGEEDPADNTPNEKGWAKNRRCDLILKKGGIR
ncbi:peptidoglycan-associated lipoprotein Pal [Betaproteobacteria bacterium]|nr:peptidoglycan-associated lipoprotein Pal [Betaproteobacteria bacterium]